jgi:hypothetical protein
MTERKGGYLRPVQTTLSLRITDTWQGHKNRTPPSTEPGTDYGVAYGSSVYASEDGVVAYIDTSPYGAEGRRVCVQHPDGQMTSSIHLSRILVSNGQRVKRGQEIAKSGASAWGKEWGVGAHVHHTLFPTHALRFGTYATLDFELQRGADNDGSVVVGLPAGGLKYSQTVANQQNWMNSRRSQIGTSTLVVDGLAGPRFKEAVKKYQSFLRKYGYTGPIDGAWGRGTQTAHQKYYDAVTKKPIPILQHRGTVADAKSLSNVTGLQKIARLYVPQPIDNIWGAKSRDGLQRFLNQNYGGSLPAWLRAKHGYVGNDVWGPNMKAALTRANEANRRAL